MLKTINFRSKSEDGTSDGDLCTGGIYQGRICHTLLKPIAYSAISAKTSGSIWVEVFKRDRFQRVDVWTPSVGHLQLPRSFSVKHPNGMSTVIVLSCGRCNAK